MNTNFRKPVTKDDYDRNYGVDVLDHKGKLVVNLRTYAAARIFQHNIAKERANIIAHNHNADMAYSAAVNAYWNNPNRSGKLPEKPSHKRPPQLVTLRYYKPGLAPIADTANA